MSPEHAIRIGSSRARGPWARAALAALVAAPLVATLACSGARLEPGSDDPSVRQVLARGTASWYGARFHGRRTASGEVYDMHALTAAHRRLPFGTWLEVTNLETGRRVVVRVNDRGPFVHGRIVDLSYAAARAIGLVGPGTAKVELALVAAPPAPPPAFAVQVAAFREGSRAEALAEILVPRYPETAIRSDGTWHRVQVGRFGRRDGAEALRRELEELGWAGVVVALPRDGG